MTKYRIVTKNGRYRIQYRFALFFWAFHKVRKEEDWSIAPNAYWYEVYETSSLHEAQVTEENLMIIDKNMKKAWTVVKKVY